MGDAKLTTEERVDKVELCADECNSSSWVVLRVDAIRIAEEHAAAAVAEVSAQKDGAYDERNRLVAALAAMFPSAMSRHPDEDTTWDDDWRWIVFVDLPTGQASWHLHDSHLSLFDHVQRAPRVWDGHTTPEKYERVARFCNADAKGHREVALVAAAVAEVAKERDQLREDVERCAQVGWYGLVEIERKNASQHYGAALALAQNRDRAVCRAEQAEARVAELEALLRESQDLFMEAGPFHALRPAIKAQWRRRARAHINALASALAPQAPPARKEGE